MKKRNGFIASSVIFSFFLIFTMISLLVLASYSHYRSLSNELNGNILDDLNENVILHKFVTLDNVIVDGDLKSVDDSSNDYAKFHSNWITSYSFPKKDEEFNYVSFKKTSSNPTLFLRQNFDGKLTLGEHRKIYVAFKHKRTYKQDCLNEVFNATLYIGNPPDGVHSITSNEYEFQNRNLACDIAGDENDYSKWQLYSHIFENVNVNSNIQYLEFDAMNIRYNGDEEIGITDIMVVDVTSLYNENTDLETIHGYLDSNLPFIEENYPLAKLR